MALIGHEIIQSRVWVDPTNPSPPNLNYKYTFPITVFDAVRRDMANENSETLTQALENISQNIKSKQPIIPAKPANYLMTYAGVAGAVGSIQISEEIPWDAENQSSNRIPTEKAVGDLIRKLGIDPNNSEVVVNVRWSDIIARPNIYNSLGNDDHGIVSQKTFTEHINAINSRIDNDYQSYDSLYSVLKSRVDSHTTNMDNPHNITLSQLGAASAEAFDYHTTAENPHGINAYTIGLGNVNNTSDMDKPISNAVQEELNKLFSLFNNMTDGVGELSFITKIDYDKEKNTIDATYRDGNIIHVKIPIGDSITNIRYDSETKEFITIDNSGKEDRVSVSDLFVRYIGSEGSAISITIDGDQTTGDQIIKASINPKSIKGGDIADNTIANRSLKENSITSSKIKDLSITTAKYADRSITADKIAKLGINGDNIADRTISGRTLFSSSENNRILATIKAGQDPVWTLISSDMIGYDVIQSKHIVKHSITHDKIDNSAISTNNIEDLSITTDKIKNKSITSEKIKDKSIESKHIASDLILEGTPKITNTPDISSDNNDIVNTHWVRLFAEDELIINTSNISNRSVTGDKLFSSDINNRVLAVTKANQDPVWSLINNEMMDVNSVGTLNIINKAITSEKIKDKSIESKHLSNKLINSKHIQESSITSEKIYTSHEANRVLAALNENGHPTYSQVTKEMMAPNSVGTKELIDGSITLSKLESSKHGQQVMTVGLSGSNPVWSKVMTQMIQDRAVDGSKLFTSERDNVILGLTKAGSYPAWIKVTGDMIDNKSIKSKNIGDNVIESAHIKDEAIDSRNIKDGSIENRHIKPGTIKPESIETSSLPGRVIAISDDPYSTPKWLQVNTSMIEDGAVSKEKIFKSNHPYRVLGATQAGTSPEYLMITHNFIVDGTIIPEKLQRDFVLHGTPELTIQPSEDSDDFSLANTHWVRNTINKALSNYSPSGNGNGNTGESPKFDFNQIPDHGIDGTKLFTHSHAPRVLGITEPNSDVEFILIEESLIANGAVTTNKLQRDIHLLGSPKIEVRPSPLASDADGNGQQIPDCQWVLDRINDKVTNLISGRFDDISKNEIDSIVNNAYNSTNPGDDNTITPPDINDNDYDNPNNDTGNNNGNSNDVPDIYVNTIYGISNSTIADMIYNAFVNTAIDLDGDGNVDISELPDVDIPPNTEHNQHFIPVSIVIPQGAVTPEHIQDRAVTSEKLFTSIHSNRLLGVLDANSSPIYLQAVNDMIDDRAINGRTLFSSDIDERVLIVNSANTDPLWGKISSGMIDNNVIKNNHISDRAITENQIETGSISDRTLDNAPIIDEVRLYDNAVTIKKIKDSSIITSKIADNAVTQEKIKDHNITSEKLAEDIELPSDTTIKNSEDCEKRSIRNITISPKNPQGGKNGDIWFKFS